jgi:NTP pyrophosphatase (non-canonical NTP hydrolase)
MASSTEETLDGYQAAARALAVYPGQDSNAGLIYTILGLTGEAGEVADRMKKILRDGPSGEQQVKLIAELGDTLWYVSQVAAELHLSMSDLAEGNLDKLRKRYA